ncbi:N-acetylmuramoyl-L-alanine amidase [Sphingomonas morindae]|uniref:N-acetylmuramoyl-L-alanine amidase n=1 Tax=Sphingomonas morindae TaxID=1541170 RepID=A0ABY4X376_9SPHN|nr:N-acetylmuramoyl-L-alanine amidase [Sphingomonas morindae]USI71377.1 N-acetylmuramoyl-L-alanine amidase [Sphingomonas morindae]
MSSSALFAAVWSRIRAGLSLGPLALLALATPAAAARITALRIADDGVLRIQFDEAVQGARAFVLAAPCRLAVDLGGITGAVPRAQGGPVVQTRIGTPRPGTTRLVFDLTGPAIVRQARLDPDGRTLTLRLAAVTTREFGAEARAGIRSYGEPMALLGADSAAARAAPGGGVTVPLDPPIPYPLALPRVEGRRAKPLVVIDAGHGGHDPGSIAADGRQEKDAALGIARAIRDELLAGGQVRVALTRSDDRFLTLGERPAIARRLGADLFISVHADSAPGSGARGATVYTLSEVASDRVAARLAAKENRADILHGVDLGSQSSDVSSILIDLTQRETMNSSSRFADLLQRELTGQGVEFKTSYHRFAGLAVLKAPDVPAVLLETGYMSSPEDLDRLFSRGYRHDIARGVSRAIEAHFARRLGHDDLAARE